MLSKSSEAEMRCLVDSDIHKLIDSKTFNFRGSHPITHQIDLHPFVQRTLLFFSTFFVFLRFYFQHFSPSITIERKWKSTYDQYFYA